MNCLEFRRQLAIDPATAEAGFAAHRDSCVRCAGACERALGFERSLALALAVPVPDGLADRILLRQTTSQRTGRAATHFTLWRMAAGLVLALGAASLWYRGFGGPDLADLAVEHIQHEPYALLARGDVAPAQIEAVFARSGVKLVGQPGAASYLQRCTMRELVALHIVTQRDEGPVTVLFVPDARESARKVFARGGLKGRSVPMANGTLVLLASQDQSFDQLELDWSRALGGGSQVAWAEAGAVPDASSASR